MPKRTKDELYYRLWFEALRLSDDYKKVCEWVENQSIPEKRLDWSQYPHIKETYLLMENVFSQSFNDWYQQRKPLSDTVGGIFTQMQVHSLDLSKIINEGLNLFKDEFGKDFDGAKDRLLAWTTERLQQPENLIVTIDTGLVENAKDVQATIQRLIVQHRGINKAKRRNRLKEIGLYLDIYRKEKGLQPITDDGWPTKEVNYPEQSDLLRMIRKAKGIIDNATKGDFPGEY